MATNTQNPEPDNRHKTLTLTPINPPDLTDESTNPSSNAKEDFPELQSQSATVNLDEGTEKKEVNDAKVKGTTQAPNSVVSPTGDSGPIDDTQKKLRRAERFGVPVQLSEKEKRNSRAERFGTSTGSETSKASEEQKRKARAERFGLPVPADEAKKKARLAKFESDAKIDTQEEEKRKARAIRFSQPPSNVPHINCEGDVGQKTAIAGEAGGGV